MIFRLLIGSVRRGKARFVCAVCGIAVAVGAVVFMTSLVATNRAQAPELARRACHPWVAWKLDGIDAGFRRGRGAHAPTQREFPRSGRKDADVSAARPDLALEAMMLSVDYRPGGHVLQGPPMMVLLASAPESNPYGAVRLEEGRWVDRRSADCEVVCVRRAMRRFGRHAEPAVGSEIKFVGRCGTMSARVVGYLDGDRLPAQFPTVFANASALAALAAERKGTVSLYRREPDSADPKRLTAVSPQVVASFTGDEQKRMDYATPLLLVASVLTALSLLVNSLLLSVESNRMSIAVLRTVGLTRFGVARFVFAESLFSALVGWMVGTAVALAALAIYVRADAVAFPVGFACDIRALVATLAALPPVAVGAAAFALAPALKVRGMDAAARRPRSRRHGMGIAFAFGFAAFVAVEVWGASLMRAFVPSPEWPDAIVSLLPGGVSSFDVEKLRTVEGVRRIGELVPRQVEFPDADGSSPPRNALFLGAEWLPRFRFVEGDWDRANAALKRSDSVVITEMMSRARGLHVGDALEVMVRAGRGPAVRTGFPIVGVVDLNWHMVTSRGLVRGLNGMPGMTDGPVFASLDTLGIVDPRTYVVEPAMSANMTHLWVEYEPAFLARHGVFAAGRRIEAEIARRLGDPATATVRLHARDEIADGTLAHGSDLIGQAARVPFVFLAILSIGFIAMLVSEAECRRHEFAVLRTVGATRSQVAVRLAASALKTAMSGIAVGFPVGALTGWLCTFRTGNWPGLPHWFVVPWRVTAEGTLGALLFALLFAVPTALALVRGNLVKGGR